MTRFGGHTSPRRDQDQPSPAKEAPHRGATDGQPLSNRRFAEACSPELPHSVGVMGHGRWPSVLLAAFPGLHNAGFHPLAQNLTLELGKDRQHPGQRPPRGRGEVGRFMQRDKAHACNPTTRAFIRCITLECPQIDSTDLGLQALLAGNLR
jgi:hypothetical protein